MSKSQEAQKNPARKGAIITDQCGRGRESQHHDEKDRIFPEKWREFYVYRTDRLIHLDLKVNHWIWQLGGD